MARAHVAVGLAVRAELDDVARRRPGRHVQHALADRDRVDDQVAAAPLDADALPDSNSSGGVALTRRSVEEAEPVVGFCPGAGTNGVASGPARCRSRTLRAVRAAVEHLARERRGARRA